MNVNRNNVLSECFQSHVPVAQRRVHFQRVIIFILSLFLVVDKYLLVCDNRSAINGQHLDFISYEHICFLLCPGG